MNTLKTGFFILFFFSLLSPFITSAQVVISNGGDHFENESGSISWTLGQFQQVTHEANGFILSQGFHQPNLIITGIVNFPDLGLRLKAFPNPSHDLVQLEFEKGFEASTFNVRLINMVGKVHLNKMLTNSISTFDLSPFPKATYFLQILSKSQVVSTIKLLKQ